MCRKVSVDANGNAGFCEVVEQSCDDDDNDGDGDADCADSNCPECSVEDCTSVGDKDETDLNCADGCTISIDAFGNTGFCEPTEQVVKIILITMVMI